MEILLWGWLIFAVITLNLRLSCALLHASLDRTLSHYEVLHLHQVRHSLTKRGTADASRDVEFNVFGRSFHLRLREHRNILSHGFRVISVDGDGLETVETLPTSDYYHGYELSNPQGSHAIVYFEDDHAILATIEENNETYYIEPTWRHMGNHNDNGSMIAYRHSDINMENDLGNQFCPGVRIEQPEPHNDDHSDDADTHYEHESRIRRQTNDKGSTTTPTKNTCPLYLIADYRFYQNMGESNIRKTTSYLLSVIDRIDHVYRDTVFSGGLTGMGFEVKEIRIHKTESIVVTGVHYNMDKDWGTTELLEVFSRTDKFKEFCLAHLFTYIPFSSGVLGLAYIGSPRTYSVGGICTSSYRKGGRDLFLNTGWSSGVNKYDRRLLTAEAVIVTTHEFGHNWGSEHDPDTSECSPSGSAGGKHIMYTYSVSGYDSNNRAFSNCSKRNIGAVLQNKANRCFEEESGAFCGNFKIETNVDDPEECDAGPSGRHGDDPCCNEVCKLRSSAQCSDANHECCQGCRFLNSQTICHQEQEDSCQGTSHCRGDSGTCPAPPLKGDDSPCINKGKCKGGECLSFCESEGLLSCVCETEATACMWCCKTSTAGLCMPHRGNYSLPNGTSCLTGFCDNKAVCVRLEQDLVQRLWDVIEDISPDRVLEFMRDNIVGTVIILSLVVWIPSSCIICHLDRKKKAALLEQKAQNMQKERRKKLLEKLHQRRR